MVSRFSLLVLASTVSACFTACRGSAADLPNNHRLSANALTCQVDPTTVMRTIPRGLFGTNLEWFNSADGISDADGNVASGWIDLAKAQGIDNVRFPGGTLSDFYHWQDGIGPVASRPVRDHPTDTGKSANVFGTPEFLKFCSAIQAQPLITVNAGTGTAEEAASWVAYCNAADNAQRLADGISQPANVHLWEIGNELYLPGNPTDKQIITIAPDVYAARFKSFAKAMRKVDPSIKLMAIGTANASIVTLPYPNWSDMLLSAAAGDMDYIAIHNSYFPLTFNQTDVSLKTLYQGLWAAPEAVNDSINSLNQLLTKYEGSRHIEIAITEWGALFSNSPGQVDHVKTMGTAVYLARLFQVFLGQPRVTLADYFKFTDRSFMGWVGYDQKPKIPYYVIQLFSQHFGTRLVAANVSSPTYDSAGVGISAARKSVPELTVSASLDATGKKMYINFINRSWNTIHQVKLSTGSFKPAPDATLWSISAPGLTDNNGRDLPDEVPKNLYTEPVVSKDFKQPVSIVSSTIKSTSALLIQPYSISTVELTAQP